MANYGNWGYDETFIADIDLNASQYCFVKAASTAGKVNVSTGGSNPAPLGVLQNDPRAGEEAVVRIIGPTLVYADGTITWADHIASTSVGGAVAVGAGSNMHGRALEGSTATGSAVKIHVFVAPNMWTTVDNTP